MKALVTCPTYARIPLLGRVLASFMSQTYEDKHLVFVNDDPNVKIKCDRDDVTCVNLDKKILLPQKRNIANSIGYYDVILPHDDDDIFLPTRVESHVKFHKDNPDVDLHINFSSFVVHGSEMQYGNCSPTACSYKQSSWWSVGGYAHHQHTGDDQEFFNKIPNKHIIENGSKCDFIYNWGGMNYHASYVDVPYKKIAKEQLESMGLFGKEFNIEPDVNQYSKFVELTERLKIDGTSAKLRHLELGKIEI